MALPRVGPALITRPRLLDRLHARTPLTVLQAPLGFGKTTLAVQWLSRDGRPDESVAWLRVRPQNGDADSFWLGVVDALTDAGRPLPARPDLRSPRALAERMLTSSAAPLLLVVDCWENLDDDSVDQRLLELLWDAPALRLLFGLRGHRPCLDGLSPELETTLLGAAELRFTPTEIEQLFRAFGIDLTPELVSLVHDETSGWPEPTKLLAQSLTGAPTPLHLRRVAETVAVDYLRRRMTPEIRRQHVFDLALRLSLPGQFTADTARAVAGDGAVTHLDPLARNGLLLAEAAGDEVIYRWPRAARQALLAELRRRQADELPELHHRLAAHFVAAGRPGPALEHAVAAENWPLVVQIVESTWRSLMLWDADQLHRALVAIPPGVAAGSVRVRAVRDLWLGGADDELLANAALPEPPAELADLGRRADVYDVLDGGFAVLLALRCRGLFARAAEHACRLAVVAAAARVARPTSVVPLLPTLDVQIGLTLLLGGDLDDAAEPLRRAYDRAGDSPMEYAQADAAASLALLHAVSGEADQAQLWTERRRAAPPARGSVVDYVRNKADVTRLLTAIERLDLPAAAAAADGFTEHPGRNEFWVFDAYAWALYALHAGPAAEHIDRLARMRSKYRDWLGRGAIAPALLAAAEADLQIAIRRGNRARAVLEGPLSHHPLLRVGQARLALLSGEPRAALRIAQDSNWRSAATTRQRSEMLVLRAVAAHRTGAPDVAVAAARRAVETAAATGALRAFTTVPRRDLVELSAQVPALAEVLAIPALRDHPDLFPATVTVARLTDREARVLEKLSGGLTVQQTADALVVSYNTVKTQQRSIFHKLGVDNRADAVARARRWGLL